MILWTILEPHRFNTKTPLEMAARCALSEREAGNLAPDQPRRQHVLDILW
jgi:hypothetical protein